MAQSTGAEWWRSPIAVRPDHAGIVVAPLRDSVLPFAALLTFMVALFLAPQAVVPGLGRVRIALLTGAFAIAAHCWSRFASGRPLIRFSREVWLVVALFAWILATFPMSLWPPASRPVFFDYLNSLAVFWLLSSTDSSVGRLRTVAWTLSLIAVVLAATGLWNYLSGHTMAGRAVGDAPLTADPNGLAMVLNLILPLTVALFLVSRGLLLRGLLVGLIVLEAGAIFVTFSRGGFLVLATTFVLYLRTLHRWGQWRWAIAAATLAIAAIPLLPPGYLDRLGTIRNIQRDESGSAQLRHDLNRTGMAYTISHPLVGAGLGTSVLADCALRRWSGLVDENCARACLETPPENMSPCMVVHNAYLQHGIELGWPGLGLFLLLLVSCARRAGRVRDCCAGRPALQELAALAEAVRISVVAFAVAALFYPWAYSIYFYYAAGLGVAVGAVYETEASAADKRSVPVHAG